MSRKARVPDHGAGVGLYQPGSAAEPGMPGLATCPTELSRSSGGQWSLFVGGKRVARTRDQDMDDAAAKEWAEAVLGRRSIGWVSAHPELGSASGRWVGW